MMNHSLLLLLTTIFSTTSTTLPHPTRALATPCNATDAEHFCHNDGHCHYGSKPHLAHIPAPFLQDNLNDKYCECGEGVNPGDVGFTGVQCMAKYEICEDAITVCFHGGSCVRHVPRDDSDSEGEEEGNSVENVTYGCDCSTVNDSEGIYVGTYCEVEVTELCPTDRIIIDRALVVPKLDGDWYCAHGTCHPQHDTQDSTDKCICLPDYHGPHCEYTHSQTTPCELPCLNGGECHHGIKNYNDLPIHTEYLPFATNVNGQHCICPLGFTGLYCEVNVQTCGNEVCLYGSTCLEVPAENGIGMEVVCDCSHVNDEELVVSGRYCEYESTSVCDSPSGIHHANEFFCTNNGSCPTTFYKGCTCPNTYTGFHCEFPIDTTLHCTLDCQHDGTCTFGKSPHPFLDQEHVNFMHCQCPDTYTGLYCDVPLEICGTDDDPHVCAFGGKCVEQNDGYTCDCKDAGGSEPYAGFYCEYKAEFCSDSEEYYCTNGVCHVETVESEGHPGCDCNDGYSGTYCELTETTQALSLLKRKTPLNKVVITDLFIILFLVVIMALLVFYGRHKVKKVCQKLYDIDHPSRNQRHIVAPTVRDLQLTSSEEDDDLRDVDLL